jgi:hypothetical protein
MGFNFYFSFDQIKYIKNYDIFEPINKNIPEISEIIKSSIEENIITISNEPLFKEITNLDFINKNFELYFYYKFYITEIDNSMDIEYKIIQIPDSNLINDNKDKLEDINSNRLELANLIKKSIKSNKNPILEFINDENFDKYLDSFYYIPNDKLLVTSDEDLLELYKNYLWDTDILPDYPNFDEFKKIMLDNKLMIKFKNSDFFKNETLKDKLINLFKETNNSNINNNDKNNTNNPFKSGQKKRISYEYY